VWLLSATGFLLGTFSWTASGVGGVFAARCLLPVGLGWRDTRQRRHSLPRNDPVIGHLRFLFEYGRPELRRYFIEGDNEPHPSSRQQRSLAYQRANGDSAQRLIGGVRCR
jgi:hypothetical protein